LKWLSRFDTSNNRLKFARKLFLFTLMFISPQVAAQGPAFETSSDLRDSCRNQFAAARESEAQLEALKNLPLRMVRIGGELDVALYDRLAQVRRQRIAAASVSVRTAQSVLSGCLARQLTVRQIQRMPAAVPEAQPSVQVNAAIPERVYVPPQPIQPRPIPKPVLRSTCNPETEEYGCPVEPIRVDR
jgi:hypothetical protein